MVVIPVNLAFYQIDSWENFQNGERMCWFPFMDFLRNGKDTHTHIFSLFVFLLVLCLFSF